MSQKIPYYYSIPAIILSTLLVAIIVLAWTEPSVGPPGGNVLAPLNVGPTGQTKEAGLLIANNSGVITGLIVRYGNVGIGTANPGAKIEVVGQIKITGGSPGANKVLTSDASGLASWQTPTAGIGGSGSANYVSKWTDATTLGNSLIYDNGTNVGIGTANPSQKLDVAGYVKAQTGLCIGSDCRTSWPSVTPNRAWTSPVKYTFTYPQYVWCSCPTGPPTPWIASCPSGWNTYISSYSDWECHSVGPSSVCGDEQPPRYEGSITVFISCYKDF